MVGGVVSMSWGDPEVKLETRWDKFFTTPGVVYFAASGDSGIGVDIYPARLPNVVSVGGTSFNRDNNGNFVSEVYGGGGGDTSPYEPIPSYQSGIASIVGTHRGYPMSRPISAAPPFTFGAVGSGSEAQVGPRRPLRHRERRRQQAAVDGGTNSPGSTASWRIRLNTPPIFSTSRKVPASAAWAGISAPGIGSPEPMPASDPRLRGGGLPRETLIISRFPPVTPVYPVV